MSSTSTLIQKLGIKYPIIQGPFGGGFSTAKLAAAVSNHGGLGSFGAHGLTPEEITNKIQEIRNLTDRPFSMNLWVSYQDDSIPTLTPEVYAKTAGFYQSYFDELKLPVPPYTEKFGQIFSEQIEAIIEAKPPVFSFVFGIPNQEILERCRQNGIVTIGAATTLEEALANEKAGVDCLVVTGFEAGGHRPSFLKSAEDSLTSLSDLLGHVNGKIKLPLIAAGGISNLEDIQKMRNLGAHGFQLGTAFLACEESAASPMHRQKIFTELAHHTTLSRHYSGRLARFMENDFIQKNAALKTPHLPYPAQNYLLAPLKKVSGEQGRTDITPLYAGMGAPRLKHKSVKDLMAELISGLASISKP